MSAEAMPVPPANVVRGTSEAVPPVGTPFEGLPPFTLPPGSALVFAASLWWAASAYGPRHYERRARDHLESALARAPGVLSAVHAGVRDAARACLVDPTHPECRRALSRALDAVIDHARRQPPAPVTPATPAAVNVWWDR